MKNIRVSNFHKILALLLAFAALLPVVFAGNINPFAYDFNGLEDWILSTMTEINKPGVFTNATVIMYDNIPDIVDDYRSVAPAGLPETFTVMFSFTDPDTGAVWYMLDTENWENWEYTEYGWVRSSDVLLIDQTESGGTVITDALGKQVEENHLIDSETWLNKSFSLYYMAQTTLTGNVTYQWQMLYNGSKWVDIMGETADTIRFTYGKLCQMMQIENCNRVYFRCVTQNDTSISYSRMYSIDALDAEYQTSAPGDETLSVLSFASTVDAYSTAMLIPDDTFAAVYSLKQQNADLTVLDNITPDVNNTYNIVINYQFEDGTTAADSWTAQIGEGTSFSQTVTSPTIQGYLPYFNDAQNNDVCISVTNMSEDITHIVTYKPTNVNYTVIHYKQNINDDNYTIESTKTVQGLTASQVPEVAKTFEGFYSLLYERPNIAADGSTIIEIYYDRFYYLMNFDMDGGYGTEPVYARYGAEIGTVEDPTKAGYTFQGWSKEPKPESGDDNRTAVTLPTTMPAESKTYYAIWKIGNTTYTVTYWLQNADNDDYSYLGSATEKAETDATVSGSDDADGDLFPGGKNYYECNLEKTDKDVTVEADGTTVVNVYYDRKTYTLKFYYMRSYSQGQGGGGGNNKPSPETTYQIPTNTNGYTDYSGKAISNATWTTVNSKVSLNAGYSSKIETKNEQINGQYEEVTYYYLTIIAKYGANLSEIWPNAPFEDVNSGNGSNSEKYKFVSWGTQYNSGYNTSHNNKNIKGPYSILDEQLIVTGSNEHNMVAYWATDPTMYTYEIYYSLLYGDTADQTYEGCGYKKQYTYTVGSTDDPSGQSNLTFAGVTYVAMDYDAGATKTDGTVIRFYYKRNEHNVAFDNQYGETENKNTVYGQSLFSLANTEPDYPESLETGAYEFGGWYKDPSCTDEADFSITMPDENLVFYAKWVPVTHTVKFYLTEKSESIYKPDSAETEASFTVSHGDNIAEKYVKNHLEKSAMNNAKPNGDYTFVMWYYYEDGVKKPFDPTTQIRKDLTLYGEWSSNTHKQYTVQYVLQSDHSVKVADDLTGSGLAGTTKTFDAKGGTQLYADYQEGYFPTVQSQSLLLDIDSNSLVITFEYVPAEAVPYTVKYVEKDTGNSLADDKVVSDNRKAVVTETFKAISGYMPDAYQKRLVVTAKGENILYFYYTKDEAHAYYKITHYTQNTDGTTWTEYASSQAVGDIGTRYTASPMTIPGFTYNEIKYVADGTEVTDVTTEGAALTADGLEINLYYVRNEYPYQVRYLEQGSGKQLADPKNGTGKYGQVISESAVDIAGYDKVDPTSATLNIRIDEGEGAPNINIITFYYKEKEVTINYVAVGPEGATDFGSVSPTTETVKVNSGTAQGSEPTAGDGFKFVGWYKDEACTEAVDASWVTDNKIVPQKTDDKNVAATYYAKFEYDVADLKITKSRAAEIDKDQTFIFTVTGPDDYKTTVVIKGNGSVTIKGLKIGEYTVHEENGWSWRYTCADQTITLQPKDNEVTMTNKREETSWLDSNAYSRNWFNTEQ